MRIAILISGFLRSFRQNYKQLQLVMSGHDIDIYLHISTQEQEDRYMNEPLNYNNIIDLVQPVSCIIEGELPHLNNIVHVNQQRMWYKIYQLNQLKQNYEKANGFVYDLVIRYRPDLLFTDKHIDWNSYITNDDEDGDDNTIYHCGIEKHPDYVNDELNFGSSGAMDIYCDLFSDFDTYSEKGIERPDDYLHHHILATGLRTQTCSIKYKLILTHCNIIAIAGDSSSGKTTLMNCLEFLFESNVLKIEGDRYHKWERGDINWSTYTHLNPEANHISKYNDDVYDLKIGNDIYQVDYDHSCGQFTSVQRLASKSNVMLCGLHSLYDDNTNNLINLKIFMDTEDCLRIKWKIKRDVEERNHDMTHVLHEIGRRKNDYIQYIKPQAEYADIIINFYTAHNPNSDIALNIYINDSINITPFVDRLGIVGIPFKCSKVFKYNKTVHLIEFTQQTEKFNNIFHMTYDTTSHSDDTSANDDTINSDTSGTMLYYQLIKTLIVVVSGL